MKNKRRILLTVLVLSVLSLLFTACGQIDFTYRQNSDGTYSHYVAVTLGDDISATGFDKETALDALQKGFTAKGYDVVRNDGEGKFAAVKNFANLNELKNDLLGNGLSVGEDGVVNDDNNPFVYKQDVTGIPKISKTFFVDNAYFVKGVLIEGGLTLSQADSVLDGMKNADTTYRYVTPYKSVKSDADTITKNSNGYYVHTWNGGGDDTVHIAISGVKGATWYGVAIVAAASLTLVIAVVKMIKDRRHGKKAAASSEE